MIVLTSSVANIAPERIAELGIVVVDHPLFLNGEPHPVPTSREGLDALRDLVGVKANKITTSGLQAGDVEEAYARLADEQVISFHQSYANSRATAEVLHEVGARYPNVEHFDSTSLTSGFTVQLLAVAMAAQEGLGLDEMRERMETHRAHTGHLAVLYDLFFLHRSGRLGLARAIFGTAMRVIPLLSATEESGVIKSIGKVRSWVQANQRFMRIITADMEAAGAGRITVALTWCGPHEEEVAHLRDLIEAQPWQCHIEAHHTAASNMPHEGPDFYEVGYIVHAD